MNQPDVIIAGAGPVGLVAANLLADEGASVLLLEAEDKLPTNLRASTFQSSTLDMIERFGVNRRLIEQGVVSPRMQYRDRSGWFAEFDFASLKNDTNHPFRLQCEQHKLCELLLKRLESRPNAQVLFSARAETASQSESQVKLKTFVAGDEREISGKWLIAADGGKSTVRASVGVKLEGFTWPERYLVASTKFDFESAILGISTVSYFADPEEWYFLLRVPGMWRVMFPIGENENDDILLSDADINRRLQRVFTKPGTYDIQHRTIYSVHQRVASKYRVGRVFLAGDAAHLNNPLGGMGMNGGIHDAFSVAERLAVVVKGKSSSSILDGYEAERRPVALEYVDKISTANKRNLEAKDPTARQAWRETMERIAADPELARQYLLKVSMIESLRKYKQAA